MTPLGIVLLAQALMGGGHHAAMEPSRCDRCGVETTALVGEIGRLQNAPRRRDRDRAAHELRKCDWRCHPEVVGALAFSLLNDPDEEVREESAQSLSKMAPNLPVAHEALARAAACDPDHSTRHWARKALKRLEHQCAGPCRACDPSIPALGPVVDAPLIIGPTPEPALKGTPVPGVEAGAPVDSPVEVRPPADPNAEAPPTAEVRPEEPPPVEAEPLPPIEGPTLPGVEAIPPSIPTSRADGPAERSRRPRERSRLSRFLFGRTDRLSRAGD